MILVAEAVDQAADLDDDVFLSCPAVGSRRHQIPSTENMIGEGGIQHDHQEDGFHHRTGGEQADAGGVALDLEAFIAAHQRDDEGEDRRLDQAHHQAC